MLRPDAEAASSTEGDAHTWPPRPASTTEVAQLTGRLAAARESQAKLATGSGALAQAPASCYLKVVSAWWEA